MIQKIMAFFMSIIAFFTSLFGIGSSNNCDIYKDLSYGADERQIMDLYLPKDNDGEVGLVFFIHGGAWISGNKDGYDDDIETLCEDYGYAAAAINYRYISETVTFEDIADDIELALKKIKEKGEEKSVNINKVILSGISAGAHLALFYGYSRKDTSPISIAAVVSNCGPTDLTDDNFYYNCDLGTVTAFGDYEIVANLFSNGCGQKFTYETRNSAKEALLKASPISYIDENTVPTIINHGAKDTVVPFSNAVTLDKKLTECAVEHEFNIYANSNHGLESDKDSAKKADKLFEKYLEKYLGSEK